MIHAQLGPIEGKSNKRCQQDCTACYYLLIAQTEYNFLDYRYPKLSLLLCQFPSHISTKLLIKIRQTPTVLVVMPTLVVIAIPVIFVVAVLVLDKVEE